MYICVRETLTKSIRPCVCSFSPKSRYNERGISLFHSHSLDHDRRFRERTFLSSASVSFALRASCSKKKQSKASKLVFFVKRERIKSKTKMANNAPGRRTTRAQSSAGKKTSKTPPKSPPVSTNTKNTTKRKKKEEKEDLLQVEEIAKRVKRASIETKEEEKEGEKTKEKEETNEEEYAYAEINSVLKRLHFEARERRRTSMSP